MSEALDILKRIDVTTGLDINYKVTTEWYDGSPITDEKLDGVIYRKKDGVYYKKQINRLGNNIDIRDFGIVNDPIVDQSIRLDILCRYCDENDIYDIDFLNYSIMSSKTIHTITERSSKITGLFFRKLHNIKNLKVCHDKNDTLEQGACNIVYAPLENQRGEFILDNVTFDSYVSNYNIVSGEGDGHFFGFAAIGSYLPDSVLNRYTLYDIEFKFNNVKFDSPAISYNINVADIFSKKVTVTNCVGEYWGLYIHACAYDAYYENFSGVFRDDLHTGSGRVLVLNLIQEEPEILNHTILQNSLNLKNVSCYRKTDGIVWSIYKRHEIGMQEMKVVNIDYCIGVFEWESPSSWSKIDDLNVSNCNEKFQITFINAQMKNIRVLNTEYKFNLLANNKNLDLFRIENCNISSPICTDSSTNINTLEIINSKSKSGGVFDINDYGIIRSENSLIEYLHIDGLEWVGLRLFEAKILKVDLFNCIVSRDNINNFLFFRNSDNQDITLNCVNFISRAKQDNFSEFLLASSQVNITTMSVNGCIFGTVLFQSQRLKFIKYKNSFPTLVRVEGDLNWVSGFENIGFTYLESSSSKKYEWNGSAFKEINGLASSQPDSTATDVATIVIDFNSLLQKLKSAGLMAN